MLDVGVRFLVGHYLAKLSVFAVRPDWACREYHHPGSLMTFMSSQVRTLHTQRGQRHSMWPYIPSIILKMMQIVRRPCTVNGQCGLGNVCRYGCSPSTLVSTVVRRSTGHFAICCRRSCLPTENSLSLGWAEADPGTFKFQCEFSVDIKIGDSTISARSLSALWPGRSDGRKLR